MKHLKLCYVVMLAICHMKLCAQDTLKSKSIEAILFTGSGTQQHLVVGLGGSEGGNAWASDHWKKTRDAFIAKGYAFLAICYFGCPGTQATLDRIAIDEVHEAITAAYNNKKVRDGQTAIIGGSRGGDLALLLGSYYNDITCVVALSASHAIFPGNTQTLDHSSWTFDQKELPYIPVNEAALPYLLRKDLKSAFEMMMTDTMMERKAMIPLERIHGPILITAGRNDELIPAETMALKMVTRLKHHNFSYHYEAKIYDGSHNEPMKHFEEIMGFLNRYYR